METEQQRKERERQEDLQRLRGLRPIDDDFMRCLFRDNIPLVQHVLEVILQKTDLKIINAKTQADLKRLVGARSICLDAYCEDDSSKKYDIEIQRSDKGAGVHRARYHSSAMDVENLDAGQEFDEGEHILYVNGAYRGDDEIGKLMHDFSCSDPDDMFNEDLADKTRYFKETEEGVEVVCRVMEDMRNEKELETRLVDIKNMMETLKLTAEQAMDALKIAVSDRDLYLKKLQ